jgi:hypothetical protein
MYLALPVAMGLFFIWLEKSRAVQEEGSRWLNVFGILLILSVLGTFSIKQWFFAADVEKAIRKGSWVVHGPVRELVDFCDDLSGLSERTQAPLVVLFERDDLVNYGCPALTGYRFETLYPPYDRRTWRLKEESEARRDRILFLGDGGTMLALAKEKFNNYSIISEKPPIVLLETNKKVIETVTDLGIKPRRFK